jgi:hypothetical protein
MTAIRHLAWVLLGLTACSGTASASGPFGINVGDRIWENPACRATSSFTYRCDPLPAVEPLFKSYQAIVITAPAGIGACHVLVYGPVITRKQQREPGNKPMDEAAEYLRSRYGENFTKFDVIPTDKEMAKPEMWWMSILDDSRDYRYVWSQNSGFEPVEHVAAIAMQYRFVDDGPYVLVRYFFDNIDECRKALEANPEGSP